MMRKTSDISVILMVLLILGLRIVASGQERSADKGLIVAAAAVVAVDLEEGIPLLGDSLGWTYLSEGRFSNPFPREGCPLGVPETD